jgi:hypothetical protein
MPRSYLFAHSQLHRTNLRDWIVYKAGTLFGKSG